jgi:hypothetical protein
VVPPLAFFLRNKYPGRGVITNRCNCLHDMMLAANAVGCQESPVINVTD